MTAIPDPVADAPPVSDHVTDYDRRHFQTYTRLLDAASQGAEWFEVARRVLGLDPGRDVDHARRVYDAHLARAHWMAGRG
jgi:hypothetical protein